MKFVITDHDNGVITVEADNYNTGDESWVEFYTHGEDHDTVVANFHISGIKSIITVKEEVKLKSETICYRCEGYIGDVNLTDTDDEGNLYHLECADKLRSQFNDLTPEQPAEEVYDRQEQLTQQEYSRQEQLTKEQYNLLYREVN